MPFNVVEPCGEAATTQFGSISGSLYQNYTAAKIHFSGDELPTDARSLRIENFCSDKYLGIAIDNVLNIVDPDCESQDACYEFEADILSQDALQDGSLAVCSTADGKIHFMIGKELISQGTGEIFDDGVARLAVQVKLSEPIEDTSFHDLWILFDDGQLFCKRKIDTSLLKKLGSEEVSRAELLSVQSQVICVPLHHPWSCSGFDHTTDILTAIPFGVTLIMENTMAVFDWANIHPCCDEYQISAISLDNGLRRAAYLPNKHCMLLLDDKGHLADFNLHCGLILKRWTDWALEDFTPLASLSREGHTVLAVVRQDGETRLLEIRTLENLRERTFSAEVNPGPVAMLPLAFDLGPLAFLSCWDPWASAEDGLSLKLLMEVNPTSKMMRLLARGRFDEAEDLASAFKLDKQIILVHKMAQQIALPLTEESEKELLAYFDEIEVLPSHPDLVRACLGKIFPEVTVQQKFLETLVMKLQTDCSMSPGFEKAADLCERLRTFKAWTPPLEFTVETWATFSRVDLYNKFMEALTLSQLKNAFLLWDRHHLDVCKGFLRFGERAVEDLMAFAAHFGLESPFNDWLLAEFLPMSVNKLPSSCLTVLANCYRAAVEAVETRQPDQWPQLAISALRSLLRAASCETIFPDNLASQQWAWLASQLGTGVASPFWELQVLLQRVERLQLLRERYGFKLLLQEVDSTGSSTIAGLLLEKELRVGRRLQRVLEQWLRAFLQDEGVEEGDFLKDFVKDRVRLLEKEVDSAEIQRLSEEAVSGLSFLPFSLRMRLLLDLSTALSLPWPAPVATAVESALVDARQTGGEVALAAHPLQSELAALSRCHEMHQLLGRHGVTLPQTKLDVTLAYKAIRILVRRRLNARGALDEALLKDLDRIGAEVRIPESDVRRVCLHLLISFRLPEAALAFLDGCNSGLQASLLRSAFRTVCDYFLCSSTSVQRSRASVQQDVEFAECLGMRLQRCGDEQWTRELASLRAMHLFLRLREEDTWLDQVCDSSWTSWALHSLLQREIHRLQTAGSGLDLRPSSVLRQLALQLQQSECLPADFDFTATWLQEALASGSWALWGVLRSLQAGLREQRTQETIPWLMPIALRLLQLIEDEKDERERIQMLNILSEAWADAEGLQSKDSKHSCVHLGLRLCCKIQEIITERSSKMKALSPAAELRLLCRFSVESEDRVASSVTHSQLADLLSAAFCFARATVGGEENGEVVSLGERLLDCGLVLCSGWSLLLGSCALSGAESGRIEALQRRLQTHSLPRLLTDLLSSRQLDLHLASGVSLSLGFEIACDVIEKVVRRAPNSHKLAQAVLYLTNAFASATKHEKASALGSRFRLIAKWLQRLAIFRADVGPKLLRGADLSVLEAVIEASAGEQLPDELSVALVVDFCADFKLSADRFLWSLLEKLLSWNPELQLKSPSSVAHRLTLARSVLTYLLDHSNPAQLDSLNKWLTVTFEETDPFDYERLNFLLEFCPNRVDVAKSTALLNFLKMWTRVGPVSRKEIDWFSKRNYEVPMVFSEDLTLSPLAKTRLPFFAMLEAPEDMIEAEINPDTVTDLIEFKSVLNMNPDVMIVVAAKNLVTSHTGWANHTGASNRLAWTGPASEVDGAVWEKLMELLSAVKHPKLAFAGAQALMIATRSGWEYRMSLDACHRFADQWVAVATAGNELTLAKRVAERFKTKQFEVALEGILREHGLASPETLALLQRPTDLVQHLLQGSVSAEVEARCVAAEKIALASNVDGPTVILGILREWLHCTEDTMGNDVLDVTFNYRDWRSEAKLESQGSSEERWLPPGSDDDLQRAVGLLRQPWVVESVQPLVEEVAFGPNEGTLAQMRALFALFLAWPLAQVRAAADRLLPLQLRFERDHTPRLADFVIAVIYVCRLEVADPLSLEDFLAANKEELARQWLADQRPAARSDVTRQMARHLLLDFRPIAPQLWAEALRRGTPGRGSPISEVRCARRCLPAAAWRLVEIALGPELAELKEKI